MESLQTTTTPNSHSQQTNKEAEQTKLLEASHKKAEDERVAE